MRTRTTFTAIALLTSMAGLAHAAQTIASPPIGSSEIPHVDQAACYVRNIGTKPVSVFVRFDRSDGTAYTPTFENCNAAPLGAGRTCVVLLEGPLGLAYCSATAAGGAANLRGTIELRLNGAGGRYVWAAEDLR